MQRYAPFDHIHHKFFQKYIIHKKNLESPVCIILLMSYFIRNNDLVDNNIGLQRVEHDFSSV